MKPAKATSLFCLLLSADTVAGGAALAGMLSPRHGLLQKRAECGPGVGSCNAGSCCSEGGWCGTGRDYCGGSACQLDYSDSCDTFFGPSGRSTEDVPRPKIGNVPYGTIITECTVPGTMALTFDDGPYSYTTQLLDILDEAGVKATFFVAGNNRGKGHIDDDGTAWPGILRRMDAAGHHIASHTWTHRSLDNVNSTIQRTEMIYNEMAFRNLFGWIPTYMRPPYLECETGACQALQASLGYHIVNLNIDTKDYEFDDAALIQQAKDRFAQGVSRDPASNGYITLAHDVHYQTVVNLTSYMINVSRDRGYKLVTVGECLGDPKTNWYRTAPRGRSETTTTLSTATRPPATSTTSYATPTETVEISPDQSCGGDTGYTCQGSAFGKCCSFYGFCGSGDTYCGTGCDQDFGACDPKSRDTTDTTNGLCGIEFGATCANFGDKTCCSAFGFCGNGAEHCGGGCQEGYGTCN